MQIAALAQDGMTYHAVSCMAFSIGMTQLFGLAIYAWAPFTLQN